MPIFTDENLKLRNCLDSTYCTRHLQLPSHGVEMRALEANIKEEHVTLKHSIGKRSRKGDGARERKEEQSSWESAGNSFALPLLTGQGGSYKRLLNVCLSPTSLPNAHPPRLLWGPSLASLSSYTPSWSLRDSSYEGPLNQFSRVLV